MLTTFIITIAKIQKVRMSTLVSHDRDDDDEESNFSNDFSSVESSTIEFYGICLWVQITYVTV